MSIAAPEDTAGLLRRFAAALVRGGDAAAAARVQEVYGPLVGEWGVDGWIRDDCGVRTIAGTLSGRFVDECGWLQARYREWATAGNSRPSLATDHWGVEGDVLVRYGFGAAGSGFFGTASGWREGALTWDGTWYGGGRRVPARDVVRLDADGCVRIVGYVGAAMERVAELVLSR